MRIAVAGPGRAGSAFSLAAHRAGHDVVAIAARSIEGARTLAGRVDAEPVEIGDEFPRVDLLVIAVRDDAIPEVANALAPVAPGAGPAAVHLSGASSVHGLDALAAQGVRCGSFHPLQTLPTGDAGAGRLRGSWIAVTADEPLHTVLHELALSLGATPFDLADGSKALYHAAAAAAANFPLVCLAMAADLFAAAEVPFEATRPLVEAVVANAFEMGPVRSLTGPVARGDIETVKRQVAAVASHSGDWDPIFRAFVKATAAVAGRGSEFEALG